MWISVTLSVRTMEGVMTRPSMLIASPAYAAWARVTLADPQGRATADEKR